MPLPTAPASGTQRRFSPPTIRRWGWGVALALHAAALWWAWASERTPSAPTPGPVVVWWQNVPTPPPQPPQPGQTPPPRPQPSPGVGLQPRAPAPAAATEPGRAAEMAEPGVATGLPSGAEGLPMAAAAAAASAASAPLKLALPPRHRTQAASMVGAAMNDARSNSPAKTLESRLAAVMGDGRWTREDLGEGRKRYRRGAQCIETRPFRGAQIDPFNESLRNAPDLVGDC